MALKQGVVQLKKGIFPQLADTWTKEEKEHMLILTGFDFGEGLSLLQTVPELLAEDKCLAYSDKYKAAIDLYYPIIESSMTKEFIQAKVISLLNAASADQEKPSYMMTFLFICDDNYSNFQLAGIYSGAAGQGQWVGPEVVKGIAASLSMPGYHLGDDDSKQKEDK